MTTLTYILLAIGALIASTVSGITGIGGGLMYLPILTWGVGLRMAVPYLAMLLLVANLARAWMARQYIDWKLLRTFILGAIPGAILGALLYTGLSTFWISKALGVYLLSYVILSFTKANWPRTASLKSIGIVGVPAGFVSAVVGGSGPVVAPWFLRYGLVKEAFVGTEAVAAAIMHVTKLAVWGGAGMIGHQDIMLLTPLGLLMIVGSYFGMRLVSRMHSRTFRAFLLFVLTAVGIRFLLY
ncbi:MAG: sulfite exporter TauE/SafE family protein [Calditrichota bacterium]